MKLNRLSLTNIRSYKSEEFDFPEGSTLLSGDVGSGKTTLLLAIEYALFGLQPGQRGASLLASGETEGKVALECTIDDKIVLIERTLRRGSKAVSQEECALSVDGERRELAVTELKSRILELLHYPEEFVKKTNLLYKYTVYSPQEEMKSIITEDSETRLNLLRNIFGIDRYKRVKENNSIIALRLREEIRVLQAQVKNNEIYGEKIKENEVTAEKKSIEIEDIRKEVSIFKENRKKIEVELGALQEKIKESSQWEKEVEKAQIHYKNKMLSLAELEAEAGKTQVLLNEKKDEFDPALLAKTIESLANEKKVIETLQKEIIDLASNIKALDKKKDEELDKRKRIFNIDMCPTCLQDVSENHKHNILHEAEASVARSEKEKKELEKELQEKRVHMEGAKNTISLLELRKTSYEVARARFESEAFARKRVQELEKSREVVKKDLRVLSEHISALKESLTTYTKYKNQVHLKESELKAAFLEEKRAEIKHAEAKKELEFVHKEKERILKEMKEKEEIRKKMEFTTTLESWLSGPFTDLISMIERKVLVRVREEFSQLFNKWFGLLTTDSFVVRLDETFTPIILQRDYELDYSFLSGGERTAVALSYRLALNQILNSIYSTLRTQDLIILDEPTDGFSEQQLDKIRDILKEIKIRQLIIVSHESKMEGFVDNIIKVKKEGGYSVKL